MEVRPVAEPAAAGPPDELAGGHGRSLDDAYPSVGSARQVVVKGVSAVGVPDPDEIPERSELRRAVSTLDVHDGAVPGCRDGTAQGHRIIDSGVLVVDASPMGLSVVPDLPRPVELAVQRPVAIDPIADRDGWVVERQRVVVGREDGAAA